MKNLIRWIIHVGNIIDLKELVKKNNLKIHLVYRNAETDKLGFSGILNKNIGKGKGGEVTGCSFGAGTAAFDNAGTFFKVHTGGDIMSYPKMHSGGMVEQGRKGVVPQLRNDEVVRTLQVGEEVNSLADRRSNEILGAVAMKALDSEQNRPNYINIMAMDSKSFAEYLNENSDILMAIIGKQQAMGRGTRR